MAERKVLNKYYPADYDPAEVPKMKNVRAKQMKVRFMMPMSVQCTYCGEFTYRGKKSNSRSEICEEKYLGQIRMMRFYVKCSNCCHEIVIRTDPASHDYVVEAGARRNFEPWRQQQELNAQLEEDKAKAEKNDTMQALENKTAASKHVMTLQDQIEEITDLANRTGAIRQETEGNEQAILNKVYAEQDSVSQLQEQQNVEDEVAAAFEQRRLSVKRVAADDSAINPYAVAAAAAAAVATPVSVAVKVKTKKKKKKTTKKRKTPSSSSASGTNSLEGGPKKKLKQTIAPATSLSLLAGYPSSSESD
jgi:hypothetical protein